MIKERIVLFVGAYLLWCLLNWPPDRQHFLAGPLVAAFAAYFLAGLTVNRPGVLKHSKRYVYFAVYVLLFAREMVRSGVEVAYRVLHPQMPLKAGIVKIPITLKSNMGITFLAHSITLATPALTIDIDADAGVLTVHGFDVEGKGWEPRVRRFERILSEVFD